MKPIYFLKYCLLFFFLSISYNSFCQVGERKAIHINEINNPNLLFLGSFDFNGDGVNELLYSENGSYVLFLKESDLYQKKNLNLDSHAQNWDRFIVHDVNTDGFNDIIFAKDEQLFLIVNNQDFVFGTSALINLVRFDKINSGFKFDTFEIVDIDSDEFTDLILIRDNTIAWYEFINSTSGIRQNDLLTSELGSGKKFLSFDLENDGDNDLLVVDQIDVQNTENYSEILQFQIIENRGEGIFSIKELFNQPLNTGLNFNMDNIRINDLNKDGFQDIIILETHFETSIYYFENSRQGYINSDKITIIPFNDDLENQPILYHLLDYELTDVDKDNDLDFIVSTMSGYDDNYHQYNTIWIENINNYSEYSTHLVDEYYPCQFFDLEGDGDIDILRGKFGFRQNMWMVNIDLSKGLFHGLTIQKPLLRFYDFEILPSETVDFEIIGLNSGELINLKVSLENGTNYIPLKLFGESPYSYSGDRYKSFLSMNDVNNDDKFDIAFLHGGSQVDDYQDYVTILESTNLDNIYTTFHNHKLEFLYYRFDLSIHLEKSSEDNTLLITSSYNNIDLEPVTNIINLNEANDPIVKKYDFKVSDFAYFDNNSQIDLLSENGIYEYQNGELILKNPIGGKEFIDFDSDNDLDIVSLEKRSLSPGEQFIPNWVENLDSNNFSAIKNFNSLERSELSTWNDLDKDGDYDIIFIKPNEGLYWQENLGDNMTFSESKLIDESANYLSEVKSFDADNDGDLDIFLIEDGNIFWYEVTSIKEPSEPISLYISSQESFKNDIVEIPVKVSNLEKGKELKFSINWNSEITSFDNVEQFGIEGISENSFDKSKIEEGKIGFSWENSEGINIPDDKTLFVLKLKLIGDETLSTNIEIGNDPTNIQARNTSNQIISINSTAGSILIKESEAPTDITLSNTSIEENQASGTLIGNLFTKDVDNTEGFTYAFADGEGDDDNNLFQINNTNQLASASAFDFEEKDSYTIRIQTTDSRGKTFQKAFEIEILDVDENTNNAPTDIILSNLSVDENKEGGTLVGTLESIDENENDDHSYQLTGGEGSDDNNLFVIKDNQLLTLEKFDFEERESYSIRIQTDDGNGGKFSKSFVISINDVDEVTNESPTAIVLSNNTILENEPAGTLLATLTTTDPDENDEHTYKFVDGEGSDGNDYFTIKDNRLITLTSFDYEQLSETNVRIETNDSKGGTYQQSFTINIEDIADDENEPPTDIILSNNSIDENKPIGTPIGELSATDPDDTEFTFSLVDGVGNANNLSFIIRGNLLQTTESFDYEIRSRYTIRVKADDGKGGTFAKQFWIDVNDIEDNPNNIPTGITLSNQSIEENQEVGTLIGEFNTIDKDNNDTHSYKLIGEENSFFTINGNQLLSGISYNYEDKKSFAIRVQTDDGKGGTFSNAFVIEIIDLEENNAPTAITLSSASIEENKPLGTFVGELTATDNEGDSHTFELVSGEGDDDNGLFTIFSNELITDDVFDYEAKNSYTIRVRVTDSAGESFEQVFVIAITDINDNNAPTLENFIEDQTFTSDEEFSFTIPDNTFADQDDGDELTFTITLGNGDPLPEWLSFDAQTNTLSGTPVENTTITIRITATDKNGATASDEFNLKIEGVTAIGDEINNFYKVYPNPSETYLIIERQDKVAQIRYCRIYANTGKLIKEWEVNEITDLEIDLNELKPGSYHLELVSEKETIRTQVLKK